ncbi:MAG: hypothetical protein PHQ11_09130 [Paludibacter sp.]|nr:hypothetical protein [Paludibacter sp.]
MIKKSKSGYKVVSKKGKTLSKITTKKEAVKRLKEIEYFKKHKK